MIKLVQGNVTRLFAGYKPVGLTGCKEQAVSESVAILQKGEGFKVFISSEGVWRVDGPTRTVSKRVGEIVKIWQFE